MFHSTILGVWKFVWWELSPPKPPVATELVTKRHLFQKLYYQTMPNYQNESNTFSELFLLKCFFSMTANVTTPLNNADFYETHIAYRLAVIHSTCGSNLQSEL